MTPDFSPLTAALANYSSPAAPAPTVAAKKEAVQQSALMKQAIYGSPEEQLKIASGVLLETEASKAQEIQDMRTLDPLSFAAKYGVEAALDRHRYAKAEQDLRAFKDRYRDTDDFLGDTAGSVVSGLVGTAGGLAQFAAGGLDGVNALGAGVINRVVGQEIFSQPETSLSNYVAQGSGALRKKIQEKDSDYRKAEQAQEALEMSLLKAENEDIAAQERAARAGQGWFAEEFAPGARLVARNFADALGNMSDSPDTILSTAAEGAGSIIGAGALARSMSALSGATTLQTAAPSMMVTESGAANNQTQNAIQDMSEKDLKGTPVYDSLIAEGLSHDAAKNRMANDAGAIAGALSAPGALLAGKVSAPFIAAPLSTGRKGAAGVVAAGRNVVGEGVEETLQEGNSQLMSNAAQQAVGLDVALSDDLGENAAAGLVGGVTSSGGMQAPGAAANAVGAVASVTGKALVGTAETVAEARRESTARKLDQESGVGSRAQAEAAAAMNETGQQLVNSLAQNETTAPTASRVKDILFLSPEEAEAFSGAFPALAERRNANPEAPIERKALIAELGSVVRDKKAEPVQRQQSALAAYEVLEELRQVNSDELVSIMETGTDEDKAMYSALTEQLKTAESDPIFAEAESVLRELTTDTVASVIDIASFSDANADPEVQAAAAGQLELLSRINPSAVDPNLLGLALNQVGGGKGREMLAKRLAAAKAIAEEFQAADKAKEEIATQQDAAIETLRPELRDRVRNRKHGTYDIVREEVQLTGNSSNKMPSLSQHRRLVSDAATAGRMTEATDYLVGLTNFAESQVNKVAALNESIASGQGQKSPVGYKAYGPTGFFDQKGVWVTPANPISVAQAREAAVDARTAVALAQSLSETYGIPMPKALEIPALNLDVAPTAPVETAAEPVVDTAPVEFDPIDDADTFVDDAPAAVEAAEVVADPAPVVEPVVVDEIDLVDITDDFGVETPSIVDDLGVATPDIIDDFAVVEDTTPIDTTPVDVAPALATDAAVVEDALVTAPIEETTPDAVTPWFQRLASVLPKSTEGRNVLLDAFRPRKGGSQLVAQEDPATFVQSNIDTIKEAGGSLDRDLTSEEAANITGMLGKEGLGVFAQKFEAGMNALVNKRNAKDGWGDMLFTGVVDKVLGFNNALPLNFVIGKDEAGNFKIEPKVMQATYMGAMDWMIERGMRGAPRLDKEGVSKMFGMGRNGRVTEEMARVARQGIPLQSAVEIIAGNIERLLGVEQNPDAPINETQGLFRAMAANALGVMVQEGDLVEASIDYEIKDRRTGKMKKRTAIFLQVGEENRASEGMKTLQDLGSPFSQIFVPGMEKQRYIGEAPKQVTPKQKGNRFSEISDKARKVIDRLQKAPSYINQSKLAFVDALGDEAYLRLLGYREVTDHMRATTNKVDLERIIGKNLSLTRGLAESRVYAREAGDKPIFFEWFLSVTGRLQQKGPVTPQGDKIARELISATNSTLDLTNEAHQDALWLAIAQSIGISIEQMTQDEAIEAASDLITSETGLWPAVQIVQRALAGEKPVARTQESIMKEVAALLPEMRIKLMSAQHEMAVRDTVSELGNTLNIDLSGLLKGVVNYVNPKSETQTGYAWFKKGVIGINPSILGTTNRKNIVIAHEMFHLLDHSNGTKFATSDNSFLQPGGKIYKEVEAAMHKTEKMQKWFAYPMSFKSDKDISSELFAQLGVLYALEPTKMKKEFPNGAAFIERTLAKYTEARAGTDGANTRNTDGISSLDSVGFEIAINNARDAKGEPVEVTAKLLHAVRVVAEANQAMDTPAAKSFKTSLALEADGKTDGPLNAMIHMMTGDFTPQEIMRLAKGGLFFTNEPVSLNSFIEAEYARHKGEKTKAEDLYHLAAAELQSSMAADKDALVAALPLLRVMDALVPSFTLNQGTTTNQDDVIEGDTDTETSVEIGRNLIKNPLTVFLYGSGLKGIAEKISNAALDTFYELLSEIAAGKADGTLPKGWQSHKLFSENKNLAQDLADMFGVDIKDVYKMLADPVNTEISAAQFDALTANMMEHFATPMLEAVNVATGGLQSRMQIQQSVASVQTLIMQDLFDQAQEAQKGESGKKFPSKAEQDETYISQMGLAPIYTTEDQSFQIAAAENDTIDRQVSMTFGGRFPTRATGLRPADASVKISPFMTIGSGDGQMLLNAMDQDDVNMDRSLLVFDGVEQPLDQLTPMSQAINKSVWDGWMGTNVYRSTLEGFEQMMARLTPEMFASLSEETLKDIRRAMGGGKYDPLPVYEDLSSITDKLAEMANDQDARKAAMAKLASSTDHMAGVQAPHVNAGETTASNDPQNYQEISDKLNELYKAELDAIADRTKAKQSTPKTAGYAEAADPKLLGHIQKIGDTVPGHEGVKSMTGARLVQLLTATLPNDRKGLLKDLARGGELFDNHIYYFGSETELAAMRDELHPDMSKAAIELGIADLGEGVTLITNVAPETILHELLHARTASAVAGYYTSALDSPQHVQIAIRHLEGLMGEVRGFNALNPALAELQGVLDQLNGKPAEQMMEFIAYMLTNQDLIEMGQKQKTYQRLGRIVKAGMKLLKQLLGLRQSDLPGRDIFSNVRFNAGVLMADTAIADSRTTTVLNQTDGTDARLSYLQSKYWDRLMQVVSVHKNEMTKQGITENDARTTARRDMTEFLLESKKTSERAIAAGFRMDTRERQVFRTIHGAFNSSLTLDPTQLRQLHSLHDHVLENLTAEMLTQDGNTLPAEAETQLAFLQNGRDNDSLATFMALAQINPALRSALQAMQAPIGAPVKWDSVDDAVSSLGATAMSALTRLSLSKPGRLGSVGRELDRLSQLMAEMESENRLLNSVSAIGDKIEKANDYAAKYLTKASDAATGAISRAAERQSNKYAKGGLNVLGFVAAMGSAEASAVKGEGMTMLMNNIKNWDSARAALHDLRGATETNIPLLRLVNVVKAKLDALRQDFREGVPKTLAKQFNRKLSRQEWSAMHSVMGVSDLMSIGLTEARALLKDPASLGNRISAAEETLAGLSKGWDSRYKTKAKALATYMVKGDNTSENLLRNARAIAHLFLEQDRPDAADVTPQLIKAIERLVGLYAYEMTDADARKAVETLAQKEPKGIETVTGFLASMRELEKQKALSADPMEANVALNNALQGYIPSLGEAGAQVMRAEDSRHEELRMTGWTRVGTYYGDSREGSRVKMSYYQSNVAGKAAFRQGVAQTVHATYSGVNARTGQLLDGTAESLTGVRAQRIGQSVSRARVGSLDGKAPGEYLMPILDGAGNVVAYDRPLLREKTVGLQKDTHMGRMLGVWAGRMFEEEAAHEYNKTLLETLKDIYEQDMAAGRDGEYVNVADKNQKDVIIRDAWGTMGSRIKNDAAEIFGQDNFVPVRRELVNDAIGYRSASITDMWTGKTRVSEPIQKAVKEVATALFKEDAFRYLRRTEEVVQSGVSYAKTTIIVRSMAVGLDNILSNVLHLSLKGVSPLVIAKNGRKKLLEIQEFVRNNEKIQELKIEYAAKVTDPAAVRRIDGRIRALEAANAKMSIAPLIEAGEFSTISEDLTEADVAIREGRWADHLEKAVSKLPGGVSTVARNALITKDTALFQSLNRMVQYGDFVAKAVLYDHLINKGMDERQALDEIMEEFVQYNRLPGRGRETLESIGLLWFWNYTLRIMKVSAKTARERPLSALLMMGQAGPAAGIDSVFSGSLAGKTLDGSVWFGIGPEMGLRSPSMNPWWNMTQ